MIDRLNHVRNLLAEWQVEAVLITSATNRRWISGFTGSAARILITADKALLSTDSRYWEQAEREAKEFTLYRQGDDKDDMRKFLALGEVSRIGYEARHVTVAEQQGLSQIDEIEWVALTATVEPLRVVKSDYELAAVRAAARLTDETVSQFPKLARPGISEKALAWELEKYMRENGADRTAFEIIVASGPNSALPHHRPGHRLLEQGDIIVVDLGAELDGYKSDLTRTFYLGNSPEERFWEIYQTVLSAQEAAINGIAPGVTGQSVDSLAREFITAAGHGEHFGHGTGHGVGLDIHEDPRFSRLAEKVIIPAGAIMTVEPGIYLPDYGGVRIEDLILVTTDGPEYLSAAPKEPLIPI